MSWELAWAVFRAFSSLCSIVICLWALYHYFWGRTKSRAAAYDEGYRAGSLCTVPTTNPYRRNR